jgi:hypothetical protein
MEYTSDRTEISLKLLANGRYTWTLTTNCASDNAPPSIGFLKSLDGKLRDAFPDHVERGSGRVSVLDE